MRHRNKTNSLGRNTSHRKAMLANMATSLILNKRIKTTVAKAKVLRTYVEPVITKSKVDSTPNRRTAFRYLKDKYAVAELFKTIAPKVADRPGGYTRILKLGIRVGDNADICILELVDFNTTYNPNKTKATAKKRSRRGGKKKTETDVTVAEEVKEVVETKEEVKDEVSDQAEKTTEQTNENSDELKKEVKDEVSDQAEKTTEQTNENSDEPKTE